MSLRELHWPRRIARTERIPLKTGHGSFCLQRIHLGEDAFERQRIRLDGYLLVLAREGSVILDSGKHSFLLQESDAALIPPGRFVMTEIPQRGSIRGVTQFWFFNQRALADLVVAHEDLDELAARIALPALPFYPVRRMSTALAAGTAVTPEIFTNLRAVFTALLQAGTAPVCNFLKHAHFVPRFRLCLFLEENCLGKVDLQRIASRYPEGARAFHRDCAFYLGMPIKRWLFHRRLELAWAWLRYGDHTEHEVAARVGYQDLCQLRADLKRRGGRSTLELEVLRRFSPPSSGPAQECLPFWFPSAEARLAKDRRRTSDFLFVSMGNPRKSDLLRLLRQYPRDEQPTVAAPIIGDSQGSLTPQEILGNFLEMRTTVPCNVVSFETFEAWRAGHSGFGFDARLTQLAA